MSIAVTGVVKNYQHAGESLHILRGLDLQVNPGEVVAVLGSSGSGKSTLLSLLAGLDVPDQGKIILDGTDLAALSVQQVTEFRGRNIGVVFQNFHLLRHLTALENVLVSLEIQGVPSAVARQQAQELLQAVGLAHRLQHFPGQLSGGECQRVAIARALCIKPKLLLADEPSGSLDAETGDMVMDVLFQMVRTYKVTMILVTHSTELAARCDRQVVLRGGTLHPLPEAQLP
jgi:putative ABC transport system ATP-binding protein